MARILAETRLAKVPLVYTVNAPAISRPHVWAAMPRHAPAGSRITISGDGFIEGASATFGGVPSPRVEVLGDDRLRVQVPETAAAGPVDLLVTVPPDQKQFFSAGSASGFTIDSPSRSSFKAGDLIAANTLFNRDIEGTDGGEIQWLDPHDVSLFDLRSKVVSTPVRLLPENTSVVALAVYGGWSAARGPATYSVPSPRHRAAGR